MLYAQCWFWRMKMILKDRVTLVTGASRGIGAATAEVLAARGARVAVCARTVPDLDKLAARIKETGGQALPFPCDVLDIAQIEGTVRRVIEEWGRLDILVNNAGLGTPTMPVEEIAPEDWDRTLALNLKSAFLCVRAAAPVMKRQGYGRIVNVSSFAGRNYSRISGPQYGAAKAGLILVTINPAYRLSELEFALAKVGCAAIVSETGGLLDHGAAMARDAQRLRPLE